MLTTKMITSCADQIMVLFKDMLEHDPAMSHDILCGVDPDVEEIYYFKSRTHFGQLVMMIQILDEEDYAISLEISDSSTTSPFYRVKTQNPKGTIDENVISKYGPWKKGFCLRAAKLLQEFMK